MTFFNKRNREAETVPAHQATSGPLVGPVEAFETAVEAQTRAASMYGIEYHMHEMDWQQTQAMLDAGVKAPPQLALTLEGRDPPPEYAAAYPNYIFADGTSGYYEDFIPARSSNYLRAAQYFAGESAIDREFAERIAEYDGQIAKLQRENPGLRLMTSDQMFETVRQEAERYEQKEATDRRSWGGAFGQFAGGALASMNPTTDPWNVAASVVPALRGTTIAGRIGQQALVQGGIETVNQVAGVQEERRLLGLSHGLADAATRVGATAAGGAALQTVGEAFYAGARRFFRNTPTDPAPPVEVFERSAPPPVPERVAPDPGPRLPHIPEPEVEARLRQDARAVLDVLADEAPLSGLRAARPRLVQDMHIVAEQLSRWDGGRPAELDATLIRTGDAAYPVRVGSDLTFDRMPLVQSFAENQRAREIDPQTMKRFDELRAQKEEYRRVLDLVRAEKPASPELEKAVSDATKKLDDLVAKRSKVQGKKKIKDHERKIRRAQDELNAAVEAANGPAAQQDKTVAVLRRSLMHTDEQMRDLAPLVSRAYAKARNEWGNEEEGVRAALRAYDQNRANVEAPQKVPSYENTMASLSDQAPILKGAEVKPNETPADTALRVAEKQGEALEATTDNTRKLFSKTEEEKRLAAERETGDGAEAPIHHNKTDTTRDDALFEDNGSIRVEGSDHTFSMDDVMEFEMDDGTSKQMTVREAMREIRDAEMEFEAVSVCSIR